jgi:hypothetical protein
MSCLHARLAYLDACLTCLNEECLYELIFCVIYKLIKCLQLKNAPPPHSSLLTIFFSVLLNRSELQLATMQTWCSKITFLG